ncbi:MAG: DDE-type integrase/transposase/recombinase [Gemmatimonadetes bacterium]|nr:DDE-type integrase/transposase/recombinase [Gemmatimonadota bacterium]
MSRQTLRKWARRADAAGDDSPAALTDRSSRPHRLARHLPRHQRRQILRCRRDKRWSSLRIAQHYALAVSTVVSFLRRHGLNRLARLEPVRPIPAPRTPTPRHPGASGREAGEDWSRGAPHTHGDRSTLRARHRLGVRPRLHRRLHPRGLRRGPRRRTGADDRRLPRTGLRVVCRPRRHDPPAADADNGNYRSDALRACCGRLKIRHYFTRPYRPQTNGKAERFTRTLLHEWAYTQAYGRSLYRTRALPRNLRFYNAERRHPALQFSTPLQRLAAKQ